MAPVVTTDCYHYSKKKKLDYTYRSCVSSLRRAMPVFSVSFKTPRIVLVIRRADLLCVVQRKRKNLTTVLDSCIIDRFSKVKDQMNLQFNITVWKTIHEEDEKYLGMWRKTTKDGICIQHPEGRDQERWQWQRSRRHCRRRAARPQPNAKRLSMCWSQRTWWNASASTSVAFRTTISSRTRQAPADLQQVAGIPSDWRSLSLCYPVSSRNGRSNIG